MDRHNPVILLLVIMLIAALFGIAHNSQRALKAESDLSAQERVEAEMFNQNQELVQANLEMRERLMDLSTNVTDLQMTLTTCVEKLPGNQNAVVASPRTRIDVSDVRIGDGAVVIRVDDITPGIVGPTGSMRPLLDDGALVLEVPVARTGDLAPGDIVIYDLAGTRVIHRIVGLGYDSLGWYAIAKGDNNPSPDPDKVRFEQIKGVVAGIIY